MFKRFRNPKDKRDFVTAGVAVGVATAFNAPIGGLLFAHEEAASFWQHSLGWQAFFACMSAVMTLNLLRSAGMALIGTGKFGWFSEDVEFEVRGGVVMRLFYSHGGSLSLRCCRCLIRRLQDVDQGLHCVGTDHVLPTVGLSEGDQSLRSVRRYGDRDLCLRSGVLYRRL